MERGVLTISIDTEFAWGSFDRPYLRARWRQEEGSRRVVDALLRLFERYRVSATWAVVGHLFLRSCRRTDGVVHPEIARPQHAWFEEDWFRYDPACDAEQAPLWYAPDVVEKLRSATTPQEIGSHSFAHGIFGDAGFSGQCAADDLSACQQAAHAWGLDLKSFVFPRNGIGHTQALARHGFICYRGIDPNWFHHLKGPAKRLAHFLDDVLGLPPPTVLPQQDGAVWNVPGSVMLQGCDGWRRLIPGRSRAPRYLRALDEAVRRQRIFHLWFHPVNLVERTEVLLEVLEKLLRRAAAEREAGRLDILPMAGIVELLTSTTPALQRSR